MPRERLAQYAVQLTPADDAGSRSILDGHDLGVKQPARPIDDAPNDHGDVASIGEGVVGGRAQSILARGVAPLDPGYRPRAEPSLI